MVVCAFVCLSVCVSLLGGCVYVAVCSSGCVFKWLCVFVSVCLRGCVFVFFLICFLFCDFLFMWLCFIKVKKNINKKKFFSLNNFFSC